MKTKSVQTKLISKYSEFIPDSVVVDDVEFKIDTYTVMNDENTKILATTETAVDVSFINKVIEQIVLQTLQNVHLEKEMKDAGLFDLVERPLSIIRLGKKRLMCVRYELMIKFDIINNDCSFISQENKYGKHANIQDLFVQNVFRVEPVK